jgi:hypothetical protein
MTKPVDIGQNIALANLLEYAEQVVTEKGNAYYRFPCWFQLLPDNFEFRVHSVPPEDLSQFITKAGLGNPNPQIKKPKQWNHQS